MVVVDLFNPTRPVDARQVLQEPSIDSSIHTFHLAHCPTGPRQSRDRRVPSRLLPKKN